MKYWIFDLDGTLVDSFQYYFEVVEKIMNKKMSIEEKKLGVSLHASELFKLHLAEDEANKALMQLRQLSKTDFGHTPKFSAIEEVLTYLKAKGCQISIFTSRDLHSARNTLAMVGLNKFIDHLISGDCVSAKKPNPEGLFRLQKLYNCSVQEMVMIGDHDCDVQAGTAAGAFSIRASWHPHWEHDECSLSNKQFHSDQEFLSWVKANV